MLKKIFNAGQHFIYTMIGFPNYQAYLQHFQKHHPHEKPLSYPEFFRHHERLRYSKSKSKGCC